MQGVPVIFRGLRWPAAQSVSSEEASSFVTIHVPRGQRGRIWVPEATDATWRDLAEINLSDEQSCLDFVQRRGDPYYGDPIETAYVPTPRDICSDAWEQLAGALRAVANFWQPPDADLSLIHI